MTTESLSTERLLLLLLLLPLTIERRAKAPHRDTSPEGVGHGTRKYFLLALANKYLRKSIVGKTSFHPKIGFSPLLCISGLGFHQRYGGVLAISDDFLGDFPRVPATWYHFYGNFHRYVLSFRLGVPILDPFLEDAAMASPKRRASAFLRVGNISQVYQPYTNIVALLKGYNSSLFCARSPSDLPWRGLVLLQLKKGGVAKAKGEG